MNIESILYDLRDRGIIDECRKYKSLEGGTSSSVWLLTLSSGERYVVKVNSSEVIKAESIFLRFYKDNSFLPKFIYVDAEFKYLVYSYIEGKNYTRYINKVSVLKKAIAEVVNNYKIYDEAMGFGKIGNTYDWKKFLLTDLEEYHQIINNIMSQKDYELVVDTIERICRCRDAVKPYLIHGDFGIHNFIVDNNNLEAVIDPIPTIGDPIFDVLYAFCSSPEGLTKEILDDTISILDKKFYKDMNYIYDYMIVVLYFRVAICKTHHPKDLELYKEAWDYWKGTILR